LEDHSILAARQPSEDGKSGRAVDKFKRCQPLGEARTCGLRIAQLSFLVTAAADSTPEDFHEPNRVPIAENGRIVGWEWTERTVTDSKRTAYHRLFEAWAFGTIITTVRSSRMFA
jgi:hypothetical protein